MKLYEPRLNSWEIAYSSILCPSPHLEILIKARFRGLRMGRRTGPVLPCRMRMLDEILHQAPEILQRIQFAWRGRLGL